MALRRAATHFRKDLPMLTIGQKAPEFELDAVVGRGDFKKVKLADFQGKWVLLFFYPLDFTFVCPTEIKEHSARHAEFEKDGAVVLGCSTDSKYSHQQWVKGDLGELKYPLMADYTKEVSRKYGALLEDKGFATRASFIIDPNGDLQYALYHNTNVGRSVSEELRVLEALRTGDKCPAEWKPGQKTLGK
jgi:alkyl hydroperoxide reductase subunit AhpC